MISILKLTSRHFYKGIGSPYDVQSGLFEKAEGIDFMRYPGLLATGYVATDLDSGGSVVADKILWILPNPETGKCYAYGNTGKIYEINMTTDAITLLQTTANSDGQGAIIYKDYLIYAQDTQVGKYGLLSGTPSFDDDGISGAAGLDNDIANHPIAIGADGKCYVADKNTLASFVDVASAPSNNWTVDAFTLPTEYTIIGHLNDGRYHVIGVSRYPTGQYGANEIKIFFWDYIASASWIKEYTIPEADLTALKKIGDWIYVFTRWGVYRFNLSYSPELVVTEKTNITNLYCEAKQGAVDELGGHVLWGSNNGWAYGPPYKGFASFLSNPLRIATGSSADADVYALKVINLNKIYVGAGSASTNKLYAFKTGNSSATAKTVLLFIESRSRWEIKGLKIVMQTAGEITASITNSASTAIISDTISASGFITAGGTANPIVDSFIISLTINSGAAIKFIEVFANPVSQEYA